jgi:hypothetical protein
VLWVPACAGTMLIDVFSLLALWFLLRRNTLVERFPFTR